jgi:hypothetical protein
MPSIPASAGDMITLVARPVATEAAVKAHFSLSAVMSTLPAHIGNISAKVSTISMMFPFSALYVNIPLMVIPLKFIILF